MMNLFEDDVQLSEHDIAWKSRDWDAVQKLADSYKEKAENELFAIMNDLTYGKQERCLAQCDNYSKHWIDNAMSQHVDCISSMYVMNLIGGGLSDQAHYNYYLHTISKGKRYGKWAKLTEDNLDKLIAKLLMSYYTINYDDALMYRKTLELKGNMPAVLKIVKPLASDELIATITKDVKERKKLKKLTLEW